MQVAFGLCLSVEAMVLFPAVDMDPLGKSTSTVHSKAKLAAEDDPGLPVRQDWQEGDGNYVAPELLAHATEPTAAADMYSLGATAYECATGGLPPRLGAGGGEACAGLKGGLQATGCSAALAGLVAALLQPNPRKRPTAEVRCPTRAKFASTRRLPFSLSLLISADFLANHTMSGTRYLQAKRSKRLPLVQGRSGACMVIVRKVPCLVRIDMAVTSVSETAQEVLRRVDALSRGVILPDPTCLSGVESPIAGLVRAVTPLVLEDTRPEAGGASGFRVRVYARSCSYSGILSSHFRGGVTPLAAMALSCFTRCMHDLDLQALSPCMGSITSSGNPPAVIYCETRSHERRVGSSTLHVCRLT